MGKNRITEALREEAEKKAQERRRNGHVAKREVAPPKEAEPVVAAHRAVALVLEAGGEPYCDVAGGVLIKRPPCAGRQRNTQAYQLKASAVTGWIARLHFDAKLPPLSRQELTDTLQILEGMAIDNETPVACEDVVEQDIVLQTLAWMLRSEELPFSMSATMLLETLKNFGGFAANDPRWPVDEARLTTHLRKSRQWLFELQIGYRYERRKGLRLHCFRSLKELSLKSFDFWAPPDRKSVPEHELWPWNEYHPDIDSPPGPPRAVPRVSPPMYPEATPVTPGVTPSVAAGVAAGVAAATMSWATSVAVPGAAAEALVEVPARPAPPPAPAPAPSANGHAACRCEQGDAVGAGDAGFQLRPADELELRLADSEVFPEEKPEREQTPLEIEPASRCKTDVDAPAAPASPSAPSPAPSANGAATGSCEQGDAVGAGDADICQGPAEAPKTKPAYSRFFPEEDPEWRRKHLAVELPADFQGSPEEAAAAKAALEKERLIEFRLQLLFGNRSAENDASSQQRENCPDPDSSMSQWCRDAEAFLNEDLDL